jgi:hypothetical protein
MVKVKAKIKIEVTINHGISIVQDCCLQCKRTAGIPNNKMLFWQVSVMVPSCGRRASPSDWARRPQEGTITTSRA